jgi:hypothetical protein
MAEVRIHGSWLGSIAFACICACQGAPLAVAAETPGPRFFEFLNLPGESTLGDPFNTTIWRSYGNAPAGSETVLRGTFPLARYWSVAVVSTRRTELSSLNDTQIQTNPDGTYEVVVRQSCTGIQNCLTVPASLAQFTVLIFYRLYQPEGDICGGVELPKVSYRAIGDTSGPPTPASALDPVGATGCPPRWQATDDVLRHISGDSDRVRLDEVGSPPAVTRAGGGAGTAATQDNAYLFFFYDMTKGNVVMSARAPTYRAQRDDPQNDLGRSDGSEQTRYWSLCSTAFTRPMGCLRDEEVHVNADGYFDVVIAPRCPVPGYRNCLISGPSVFEGDVADFLGNNPQFSPQPPGAPGIAVYRNLIAAPAFASATSPINCPPDRVAQFCGEYGLQVQYVPRAGRHGHGTPQPLLERLKSILWAPSTLFGP